jgi:hypothetical protein
LGIVTSPSKSLAVLVKIKRPKLLAAELVAVKPPVPPTAPLTVKSPLKLVRVKIGEASKVMAVTPPAALIVGWRTANPAASKRTFSPTRGMASPSQFAGVLQLLLAPPPSQMICAQTVVAGKTRAR